MLRLIVYYFTFNFLVDFCSLIHTSISLVGLSFIRNFDLLYFHYAFCLSHILFKLMARCRVFGEVMSQHSSWLCLTRPYNFLCCTNWSDLQLFLRRKVFFFNNSFSLQFTRYNNCPTFDNLIFCIIWRYKLQHAYFFAFQTGLIFCT